MDHSVTDPWQFVRSEWDVLFQALIQDGFESESKSPIAAIFASAVRNGSLGGISNTTSLQILHRFARL